MDKPSCAPATHHDEHDAVVHDVCIVGAGPAGLNAALVLGRCGRDVLVLDSGQPRNAVSRGLHGYLSRDGINPHELRALGRREASRYPSVQFIDQPVATAQRMDGAFELVTAEGRKHRSRVLLLATGRIDVLPDKPGFRTFFGHGVYHCPYCDGWEHRRQKIVVYGEGAAVVDYALELLTWSPDVTLCATGARTLSPSERQRLEINGVRIAPADIVELVGDDRKGLTAAHLADGTILDCDAVFFTSELPQKSVLAQSLGCNLDDGGSVICAQHAATGVPGLYVAGNVRGGVHLAIMAAAEGAEAAIAINEELADRELRSTPDGTPARDTPIEQRPGANIPKCKQ
jgi:thioredoxin reductase